MRLRMITRVTLLVGIAVGPAAGLTPTPTPPPTNTVTCGVTATPYCADHCVPCPTVRAGCYVGACGECHENPTCGEGEVCELSGTGGCCTCVPIGGSATPSFSPTRVQSPAVSASPTAPPCDGDCNGDGAIGIDELIAAVNEALGGARPEGCASFDRDGNGVVGIEELIALVVSALQGCSGAMPVEGVYDVDGAQTNENASFAVSAIAVVRRADDGFTIDMAFSVLSALSLRVQPGAAGGLVLDGSGYDGGDIGVSAQGTGVFSSDDGTLRFAATIDVDSFISDTRHLVLTMERPVAGTPTAFSGVYRLRLHHGGSGPPIPSHLDLPITVLPSGLSSCDPSTEVRDDDGVTVAHLGGGECRVSPSGRFAFSTGYSGADVPLHLYGNLRGGGGQNVGGTFWLASFPSVRDNGIWDVVSSPP